ncbi:hypothetical protein GIB67_039888 [Kingdonia uniflora]|uniref:DUF7903 domain-containing protein n=1 Tax=Kingdonia uniflora TaxID=39325 RepID=A0A7J7P3A8_9MAGN|nr:hypothetical protein GIB67_039888 [Kingdonia uniflora]
MNHSFKNWFIFCSQTDDNQLLSGSIRLDPVLPESWVAWPNEKDLWVLMLDKSLLKGDCEDYCDVSSVKIVPWVYIADKIESDLVAYIEQLRSKMGLGECEEVLKPVFVAQFSKVVFHG